MNNEEQNFTVLTPFKMQVIQSFPYIDADFDALTNYQLFQKIVEYLNTTVNNVNLLNEEVTTQNNQIQTFINYINNYFDNLDVQEEINNKLDEMAIDGTFANILNNELLGNINNQVLQNSLSIGTLNDEMGDTIKDTDTNVVGMSMLTQEVREALTGESTAVVGINSVNNENITNGAISIYKLDSLLDDTFTKEYENVSFGEYISGNYKKVEDGSIVNGEDAYYRYYNVSLDNNTLYEFGGFNHWAVNAIIIYDPNDSNSIVYYTPVDDITDRYENVKLIFKTNKSGLKAYINTINQTDTGNNRAEFMYLNTLSKIKEITHNNKSNYIEKLKDIDDYIVSHVSSPINNTPRLIYNTSVPCKTSVYKLSKGTKYVVKSQNIYSNCGLVITNEKMEISYESNTENVGNTPVPFTYEFTATDNGYALLQFINSTNYTITSSIYIKEVDSKYKSIKWTLIGDSLTDPNVNSSVKKYYSYIQDDLGINLQNLGQSGCGYKRKLDNGNTFVEQSLLIDSDSDVVTIFGSFNDHNVYDTDGLGTVSDTTTDTVLGSVYVTLNNIITNNPNAKIGVILPTPWNYTHANPYDPTDINLQYIEGIRTIAKKFSIPVLDLFYESNTYPWNNNFKNTYYVNNDGTHLNSEGNKRIAYQIEEFIKKLV